ncbi:MAG: hypothetical protein GW946_00910 [Candidatus Pacebacteria bacterium]|nr:hypothetical protein [Candidatus Paceibacterota bacterium]
MTNQKRFHSKQYVLRNYPDKISKLDLGSGEYPEPGYTHLDIQTGKDVDILADIRWLPFPDNFITQEIRAVHVMEHFCHPEFSSAAIQKQIGTTTSVLKEVYRVLSPGARFVMVTPDFEKISQSVAKNRIKLEQLQQWSVGGHRNIYDVHHWLWTKADAIRWFTKAGFINLEDANPIRGWRKIRSLNWQDPSRMSNPSWHETEWYHWLFFVGTKPN